MIHSQSKWGALCKCVRTEGPTSRTHLPATPVGVGSCLARSSLSPDCRSQPRWTSLIAAAQ